jgi:hypothetical protein
MSPSLVPSSDHDHALHFVLCDFGKYGKSYIETDPNEADRDTIESWSRKSEQDDKWSFCLIAGTLCPANQERQ